jgi:hypothetical protein
MDGRRAFAYEARDRRRPGGRSPSMKVLLENLLRNEDGRPSPRR